MTDTSSHLALNESRREAREPERLHILATLREHGSMTGLEIVKIANGECVHEAFDTLPDLTNRGIGAKMSGLWHAGLVQGKPRLTFATPFVWMLTDRGRDHLARGLSALDGGSDA